MQHDGTGIAATWQRHGSSKNSEATLAFGAALAASGADGCTSMRGALENRSLLVVATAALGDAMLPAFSSSPLSSTSIAAWRGSTAGQCPRPACIAPG